ncbi:MAG: hypothetical protein ACOYCE_04620 [Limnochordia bacterium]|nr:hypothetical protein [Bacillota bacterium]
MNIALLIVVFLAIIGYELPGILRNGWWAELIVFAILIAMGFALGLLQIMGVALPCPVSGIEFLVSQLVRLFE